MGIGESETAQEQWDNLDEECKECYERKPSVHPTLPVCSDRNCPADLLKRRQDKYEHRDMHVPCRICGQPTLSHGTKLCDGCWELETRIKSQPDLARKILDSIDKETKHA